MTNKFDVALIQKEGPDGLNKKESNALINRLLGGEVFPLEIEAKKHE